MQHEKDDHCSLQNLEADALVSESPEAFSSSLGLSALSTSRNGRMALGLLTLRCRETAIAIARVSLSTLRSQAVRSERPLSVTIGFSIMALGRGSLDPLAPSTRAGAPELPRRVRSQSTTCTRTSAGTPAPPTRSKRPRATRRRTWGTMRRRRPRMRQEGCVSQPKRCKPWMPSRPMSPRPKPWMPWKLGREVRQHQHHHLQRQRPAWMRMRTAWRRQTCMSCLVL